MNRRVIIDRKAVSDGLYELEHLIQECIPPEDIRYVGAKRRAAALRKALEDAVDLPDPAEQDRPVSLVTSASSWEGDVDRQGGSFTTEEILRSMREGGW